MVTTIIEVDGKQARTEDGIEWFGDPGLVDRIEERADWEQVLSISPDPVFDVVFRLQTEFDLKIIRHDVPKHKFRSDVEY